MAVTVKCLWHLWHFPAGPICQPRTCGHFFFHLTFWGGRWRIFLEYFSPPPPPPLLSHTSPPMAVLQGRQVSSTPSDCDDLRLAKSIFQAALIYYPWWDQRLKGTSPLQRDKLYDVSSHQRYHFGWFTLTFLVWWPHVYTFPCRAGVSHGVFVWNPTSVAFLIFEGVMFLFPAFHDLWMVLSLLPIHSELWFKNIINYFKLRLPVICLPSQACNHFPAALVFYVFFCVCC